MILFLDRDMNDPKFFLISFCNVMVNIGELLTFGIASPPTGAALCILIFVEAQMYLILIGRHLQYRFTDYVLGELETRASQSQSDSQSQSQSQSDSAAVAGSDLEGAAVVPGAAGASLGPIGSQVAFLETTCSDVLEAKQLCVSFVLGASAFFGALFVWDMALDEESVKDSEWRPLLVVLATVVALFMRDFGFNALSLGRTAYDRYRHCCAKRAIDDGGQRAEGNARFNEGADAGGGNDASLNEVGIARALSRTSSRRGMEMKDELGIGMQMSVTTAETSSDQVNNPMFSP